MLHFGGRATELFTQGGRRRSPLHALWHLVKPRALSREVEIQLALRGSFIQVLLARADMAKLERLQLQLALQLLLHLSCLIELLLEACRGHYSRTAAIVQFQTIGTQDSTVIWLTFSQLQAAARVLIIEVEFHGALG